MRIIETPLAALSGEGDQMDTLHFADGSRLARQAIFIDLRTTQHSDLAQSLGCELDEMALVKVDAQARTNVAGVYAAGDMTSRGRAVILAAAQGAIAGLALNMDLLAGSVAQ